MSELRAWVNGRLVGADERVLTVTDRGFQLGDGVFETLRVRRGVPIELDLHLRRLRDGLDALEIPLEIPEADLAEALAAVVSANAPADAAVRITVTRGAPAARGLLPPSFRELVPTVVIQAWPRHDPPAELLEGGLRLATVSGRRDPASRLASVKTISRADHVLAKLEATRAGADDALVLTLDGHVAEATTANIARIAGDLARPAAGGGPELRTPPLAAGILAGTTRDWLLSPAGAAGLGLPTSEADLLPADLLAADEVLLCSSVAGFVAVVAIDGQAIGGGRPGAWAARLRDAREAWIREQAGG
jgi:branched-chain amino acid aminotransferase